MIFPFELGLKNAVLRQNHVPCSVALLVLLKLTHEISTNDDILDLLISLWIIVGGYVNMKEKIRNQFLMIAKGGSTPSPLYQ